MVAGVDDGHQGPIDDSQTRRKWFDAVESQHVAPVTELDIIRPRRCPHAVDRAGLAITAGLVQDRYGVGVCLGESRHCDRLGAGEVEECQQPVGAAAAAGIGEIQFAARYELP